MLVHLIYLVLVVGNNCIDAMSVLKPFILMLEKKISNGIPLNPDSFRDQRKAKGPHCTPGLSGNSVFKSSGW